MTLPSRSFARVTNAASSAFLWAVRRLAGPQVVEDTVELFRSLSSIEAGLRDRAAEAGRILRGATTAFVLVSSPRAEAIDEATHLVTALGEGGFPLRAVVVNLVHPRPGPLDGAALLDPGAGPLADQLALHRDLAALAAAEAREIASLQTLGADVPVVEVPMLDDDIHDLAGLAELGRLVLRTG